MEDVFHNILSARLEIGEERRSIGNGLEVVWRERDADRMSDGDEMQDGVGRTAEDHSEDHGVLESGSSHDVARFDVLFEEVEESGTDGVAFGELFRVFSREGGGAGKRHA